ncbi:MAG TPA: LysM peptidoglycan-binding domain-containing protein [Acidimicrobiales bacterium]
MVAISVLQPEPHDWSGAPVQPSLPETRPRRPPARSPARPLPDRATRWRRRRLAALVLATLLAVAVVGAAQVVGPMLLGASSGDAPAASGGRAPVPGEVYVVQPGDTLWSIATAVAPDRDPRPIVDRLQEVNDTATLEVGDRLVIDLG